MCVAVRTVLLVPHTASGCGEDAVRSISCRVMNLPFVTLRRTHSNRMPLAVVNGRRPGDGLAVPVHVESRAE
jgi:hypothetical protein